MKTRDDKRTITLDFFSFLFNKCMFGTYIKKKPTHPFVWCKVIPLGPHWVYT
jgi:hypothetical protein